jgi:hypothetical protein
MSRSFRSLGLTSAIAALSAFALACGSDDDSNDGSNGQNDPVEQQLDTLRGAAQMYQNVEAATGAGYVPISECVAEPTMGGMGIHYGHPAKMMAPPDPADPQILLYAPDGAGLRLVAVEFFVPVMVNGAPHMGDEATPPPQGFEPAVPPELFQGHPFDGPMPGHEEEMPWHYDQHLWLFEENPSGMFAAFNSNISCPE